MCIILYIYYTFLIKGAFFLKKQIVYGIILICLVIVIAVSLILNPNFIIPKGYSLAIDGYVISLSMFKLFILYIVFKLGITLIQK